MTNTSRTLEITVISGEGLRLNHKKPVKKNTFAIIRADESSQNCHHTTHMDTEGGSYPKWNEKFVLDMPMHAQFFTVEVQCKTSLGNKVIGTAHVPVSDFVGSYYGTPESYLHFLSYRLREDCGERNGIINLSVRVKVPEYVNGSGVVSRPRPWWTGPPTPAAEKKDSCGGVVTGVPVWYRYPVV